MCEVHEVHSLGKSGGIPPPPPPPPHPRKILKFKPSDAGEIIVVGQPTLKCIFINVIHVLQWLSTVEGVPLSWLPTDDQSWTWRAQNCVLEKLLVL